MILHGHVLLHKSRASKYCIDEDVVLVSAESFKPPLCHLRFGLMQLKSNGHDGHSIAQQSSTLYITCAPPTEVIST